MPDRRVYRYMLPVIGGPREFQLCRDPCAVAAADDDLVEFWVEHTDGAPAIPMRLQVFGTGRLLPESARWVGTCPRTASGHVWHLYDLGPGDDHA